MILSVLLLNSCEKVIEIDLAESKSALVIEANLSNNKIPITVFVSLTSPYFGAGASNPVSGAKVSVKVENGIPRYLIEVNPGEYRFDKVTAIAGKWYVVDVVYEGVTYSARSYMNEKVTIEEVDFSYFDGYGFFDSGYKANCYIRDPANKENYYRFKYFVNGKPADEHGEITLFSDKFFDGNEIGLSHQSLVFQKTDTLTVELQSIDKAAYEYFLTLENITATDWQFNAAPANPTSNFSNGALGYFSAYSQTRRTVMIKDYIRK